MQTRFELLGALKRNFQEGRRRSRACRSAGALDEQSSVHVKLRGPVLGASNPILYDLLSIQREICSCLSSAFVHYFLDTRQLSEHSEVLDPRSYKTKVWSFTSDNRY